MRVAGRRTPDRGAGARTALALPAILAVATTLRLTRLGAKPLWLDEAMTVLIALGRGPADLPTGVARPLTAVAGGRVGTRRLDRGRTRRGIAADADDFADDELPRGPFRLYHCTRYAAVGHPK